VNIVLVKISYNSLNELEMTAFKFLFTCVIYKWTLITPSARILRISTEFFTDRKVN